MLLKTVDDSTKLGWRDSFDGLDFFKSGFITSLEPSQAFEKPRLMAGVFRFLDGVWNENGNAYLGDFCDILTDILRAVFVKQKGLYGKEEKKFLCVKKIYKIYVNTDLEGLIKKINNIFHLYTTKILILTNVLKRKVVSILLKGH